MDEQNNMNHEMNENQNNQNSENHQNTEQQPYPHYNFSQPEYGPYQRNNGGYPPYQPIPRVKKEHPMLKNLGLFAAKALIASVIGAIVFGTTAVGVIRGTKIDASLSTIASELQNSDRDYPDFGDNFRNFGGQDNDDRSGDRDEGKRSSNGSDEQTPQAPSDGPKLGVSVTTVTDAMVEQGYPAGVMIAQITEGSDAANAGLKEGDIITAFDGTVVKSNSELAQLVENSKIGKSVKVVYKRLENGAYAAKETTVTFTENADSQSGAEAN